MKKLIKNKRDLGARTVERAGTHRSEERDRARRALKRGTKQIDENIKLEDYRLKGSYFPLAYMEVEDT